MDSEVNDVNNSHKKSSQTKFSEESSKSLNEKWEKARDELDKLKMEELIQFINELKKEEQLEDEFVKKYGKEPETRTPDGNINKKYIQYILRRDYGLDPDEKFTDPYENYSWGGLYGIEAYIAKWNCD